MLSCTELSAIGRVASPLQRIMGRWTPLGCKECAMWNPEPSSNAGFRRRAVRRQMRSVHVLRRPRRLLRHRRRLKRCVICVSVAAPDESCVLCVPDFVQRTWPLNG